MKQVNEILEALPQFTGTTQYYKLSFGLKATDGIYYIFESCEAFWLGDLIASYQQDLKNEEFQVYKLSVNDDSSALVEISDGNNNILAKQIIEFTDFPLQNIQIWVVNGVALLPSEY